MTDLAARPDRRPVIALITANGVSQVGTSMTTIAVPWFVLETTGSAALVGLTGAAVALGAVVTAFLGGPVVDRAGFTRASVFGDLVGNFLDVPLLTVVVPVYALTFFGSPTSLGVVIAALALGAFVGTILFGAVGRRLPRRTTFLGCFLAAPVILYGSLALTPPLAILVVSALIAGIIAGPINPLLLTVVQENTPPEVAGRVFGVLSALASAGIPIGAVLVGLVVEGAGVLPSVVAMGLIYLTVTSAMFFNPALRRMDSRAGAT